MRKIKITKNTFLQFLKILKSNKNSFNLVTIILIFKFKVTDDTLLIQNSISVVNLKMDD